MGVGGWRGGVGEEWEMVRRVGGEVVKWWVVGGMGVIGG